MLRALFHFCLLVIIVNIRFQESQFNKQIELKRRNAAIAWIEQHLEELGTSQMRKPMVSSTDPAIEQIATTLLARYDTSLQLTSVQILQSLWAGYGHICQVGATYNGQTASCILKYINPPTATRNGSIPSEGHLRKVLSYQVEQYFYTELAHQMPKDIGVANCCASSGEGSGTAMLLEDLKERFPVAGEKRSELSKTQTYAALEWLASFHGFWWVKVEGFETHKLVRPPLQHFDNHGESTSKHSVWLNGGYTYFSTRQDEYASLCSDTSSEWSAAFCGRPSNAERAFMDLSPENIANKDYTTLIHGDVKSENLFSTEDGTSVAFYDFQYVGLGLGVCDLAKLFTCSVPARLLPPSRFMEDGEMKLLQFYHSKLEQVSDRKYPWDVLVSHWETALLDWLRFQASWGMWGNTEWLEERCRGILEARGWHHFS